MAREDDILSIYPETLNLPTGTFSILPLPGQLAVTMKWVSGGSVAVIGASMAGGSSYAVSQAYLLGTSELFNLNVTGAFALQVTSATAVISMYRGRAGAGSSVTINGGSLLPY